MKLHRLIAVLICLASLVFAVALADGQPEEVESNIAVIVPEEAIVRRDADGYAKVDAYVSGADDFADVDLRYSIYAYAEKDLDAADRESLPDLESKHARIDENGNVEKLYMPETLIHAHEKYILRFEIADMPESAVECVFSVGMNVVMTEPEGNDVVEMIDMPDGSQTLLVVKSGEKMDFAFDASEEDVEFSLKVAGGSRTTHRQLTDDVFKNIAINFEESELVFECDEGCEVVFHIIMCDDVKELNEKAEEIKAQITENTEVGINDAANELENEAEENIEEVTPEPEAEMTAVPTEEITEEPTEEPTEESTEEPTAEPTAAPEVMPGDIVITGIQMVMEDGSREDVGFETDEAGNMEITVYDGVTYVFSGTGDTEHTIKFQQGRNALDYKVASAEDGEWSHTFTAITDVADENVIIFFYDGYEDINAECRYVFDRECAVTIDAVREGDTEVCGTADPEAEIVLMVNGEEAGRTFADENGDFVFDKLAPVRKNAAYTVEAADIGGNAGSAVLEIGESDAVPELTLKARINNRGEEIEDELYIGKDTESIIVYAYVDSENIEGIQVALNVVSDDGSQLETPAQTFNTMTRCCEFDVFDSFENGSYTITASYVDIYGEYESDPLKVNVDLDSPAAPVFTDEVIFDDADAIIIEVEEDCTLELDFDGDKIVIEAEAGEVTVADELPALEDGMTVSAVAVDAAGNCSETATTAIEMGNRAEAESISIRKLYDAFEPVDISGVIKVVDIDSTMQILVGGVPYGEVYKAEYLKETDRDYVAEIRFDAAIDPAKLPVDEDIKLELLLKVGDDTLSGSDYSYVFRLKKSGMQLAILILQFAVIGIGLAAAVIMLVKVSGKISRLKKSALDSENESNLTIRRRGSRRAGK